MEIISFIQKQTQLPKTGIEQTVQLLNEDCTIPFISRYRKERTGSLDEVQIADIQKYKVLFEELEKRKLAVLKSIEEQNLLTEDLKNKILFTDNLSDLEDLYLPFKRKKNSKAEIARQNGLEPLAKIIMSQNATNLEGIAKKYLNKEVLSFEDAFEGARHIMAEWINERTDFRNELRNQLLRNGVFLTKVIKGKNEDENAQKYRDYFENSESISKCPSHRLLAMLRGEKEGFIKVKIDLDNEYILEKFEQRLIRQNSESSEHIRLALIDAYKRLLFPSISNEILGQVKEKADEAAIEVFAKNLVQLLLESPLGEKNILAIDPGFRTGCKVVCLNKQGDLLHNETIFPHPPQNDRPLASKKILSLVNAYKIEAIAIGNGTASRETEAFIKKIQFQKDIEVFVVSEAGASVYSASKIAREEFPNYDVTVRGAVSIGRRLADPLAELVKIDQKSIGIGQYQHDVDQTKLKQKLDQVVEVCVNKVGVNLNTASKSLLSYVSGIGPKLAEKIVEYRAEHGSFDNREQLKQVPRLGDKAFEQSAGFLRVKNSKNPLDDSSVHPESYALVKRMSKDVKVDLKDLIGNPTVLRSIDVQKYVSDDIGLPTLQDILKELEKPGLDPREKAKIFTFNENIKSIDDLREGQLLPGIVNNITNFGCFVDIGIKESGLVHISQLADKFVSDPNEIVHLHQHVIVKVLEVDKARKRIQLTLKIK
ncbi:Tex family protein [Namhaeicola litoreus]|uniref:Tex family protein n=1 Tax=Namhaeicola litoreus TaxID=1052145 RepID=A0ABW3Y3M9_9FLAO